MPAGIFAGKEFWLNGDVPAEWQDQQDEYDGVCTEITAALMAELGEEEMAEVFLDDREEFDHLCEARR